MPSLIAFDQITGAVSRSAPSFASLLTSFGPLHCTLMGGSRAAYRPDERPAIPSHFFCFFTKLHVP
jgi:hypothetical protein